MTRAVSGEFLGSRSQLQWTEEKSGGEQIQAAIRNNFLEKFFCEGKLGNGAIAQVGYRSRKDFLKMRRKKYVFMTLKMPVKSMATSIKWALNAVSNSITFP